MAKKSVKKSSQKNFGKSKRVTAIEPSKSSRSLSSKSKKGKKFDEMYDDEE